jgi:hypothetical protein
MGDPAPVQETMYLRLQRTTQNNIASSMQALHQMQVWADQYMKDPTTEDPVWLHAKMDSETGERRALVHSIGIQYGASWFGPEATALDIPLTIIVLRGPYWENTTVRNLPDAAPSAAACVVYNYTAAGDVVAAHDIVGDVGARVRLFDLYDSASDNLKTFWMGIRSANKHGANGITNFVNIWELEDGTNSTDVSDTVDATASGGNRITVTESAVDWDDGSFHSVLYILLSNVSANPEDNFGRFLWLLRGKMSSASTWEIKLRFTFPGAGSNPAFFIDGPIVEFSSTSWFNKEMAVMPISLRNIHVITNADFSKDNEGNYRIDIYARRTSGSGDLHLDCLIPIPVDEGSCKLVSQESIAADHLIFGESPEGILDGIVYSGSNITQFVEVESLTDFYLPPGDGRIYCVYEGISASNITDVVIFNNADSGRYYERWLSLRGSE